MGKVGTFFLVMLAVTSIVTVSYYTDTRDAEQDRTVARVRRREEHEAARATYRLFRQKAQYYRDDVYGEQGRARNIACTLDLEHIDPAWACYVDIAHRERNADFVCRRVRGRMHCIQDRGYLPGQHPAYLGE